MRAELGAIHLPWLEAENRPSAFHSSCTEKPFSAAYCKGMTLSAETRLGMPARSLEEDALSHLPRHCIIFQADPGCWQYLQRHGDASKPPGRGAGARRLPPGGLACPRGAGARHTHRDTRAACAQPAGVRPAPSSRAILLLLDFSSRSILPALP